MSQPKTRLLQEKVGGYCDIRIQSASGWADVLIATAKTKKTAYKRAAKKLRDLADKAERLVEES